MLREAFRVLRTGGGLAIFNMCPHDSLDWLYYDYFPEALTRDLADFWPPEAIVAEMTAAGFADVVVYRDHRRHERNPGDVSRRAAPPRSQFAASDTLGYGLRRWIAPPGDRLGQSERTRSRADHLCFVTIRGDKPLD